MKHLGLVGAVLPIVLIGIALIGFVLTLRSDVTSVAKDLQAIGAEAAAAQERIDQDRAIRTDLDMDIRRDLTDLTNALNERINDLETSLAVSSDQQRTINADHQGFAEALRELGLAGMLPSGERREYGGYGVK